MARRPGFTIIELLVVIGLIGLIAAMSVPSFGAMQRRASLRAASDEVVSALRSAQNAAMATGPSTSFRGVRFEANQYVIYTQDGDIQTIPLRPGLTFTPVTVQFAGLTGDAAPQTVQLHASSGDVTMTVNATGRVAVQ
jgi:prepilin-type N-terminal cleavage/methylation domain-containing protein